MQNAPFVLQHRNLPHLNFDMTILITNSKINNIYHSTAFIKYFLYKTALVMNFVLKYNNI